ncbi:unnamed protein product [Brachionus calyciflorus]|uniref:Uncharacterized protein n=1 Tax=Brachionus calyciflorus TaxID=104777 RepID=A0A814AXP0_9BILA|nr:unnamed protein product [Brachionus calyciflorus]
MAYDNRKNIIHLKFKNCENSGKDYCQTGMFGNATDDYFTNMNLNCENLGKDHGQTGMFGNATDDFYNNMNFY